MLKSLLLAPGRLLAKGAKEKKRNYRSVRHKVPGGPGVILVSLLFWFLILAGLMLAVDKSGLLKEVLDAGVEVAQNTGAAETAENGEEGPAAPPAEGSAEGGAGTAAPAPPAANDSPTMSGDLQNPGSGPTGDTAPPAAPETAAAERWLVILHTIPRNARAEAERRQSQYQSRGLQVEIMDTDAFPRLVGGSWIIAQGPFDSRAAALEAANRAKEFNSNLMVRRGL